MYILIGTLIVRDVFTSGSFTSWCRFLWDSKEISRVTPLLSQSLSVVTSSLPVIPEGFKGLYQSRHVNIFWIFFLDLSKIQIPEP